MTITTHTPRRTKAQDYVESTVPDPARCRGTNHRRADGSADPAIRKDRPGGSGARRPKDLNTEIKLIAESPWASRIALKRAKQYDLENDADEIRWDAAWIVANSLNPDAHKPSYYWGVVNRLCWRKRIAAGVRDPRYATEANPAFQYRSSLSMNDANINVEVAAQTTCVETLILLREVLAEIPNAPLSQEERAILGLLIDYHGRIPAEAWDLIGIPPSAGPMKVLRLIKKLKQWISDRWGEELANLLWDA